MSNTINPPKNTPTEGLHTFYLYRKVKVEAISQKRFQEDVE
jgi:hypothetical protein